MQKCGEMNLEFEKWETERNQHWQIHCLNLGMYADLL